MRLKHKAWSRPYLEEHASTVYRTEEMLGEKGKTFLNASNVYLEIGTGKGDFIVTMGSRHPVARFVGIEKSTTALAICAKKVVEANLGNVILVNADAGKLLEALPANAFTAIFLNFSDPWPKKKHAKRRLTYDKMLSQYFRILKPNGLIYLKTDNVDLFSYSYENLLRFRYEISKKTDDYDGHDDFDAPTEYEKSFREQGIKINRLIAQKGTGTYETIPQSEKTI
ncbi:MAG: tRNA (guanosine(46)-N7)-methyltransferase TrmB [Firmicutes bacterium]|nr:tRNA (guanosine(46)-N7)-methyltransferase TrmB [Bacillota bacterium]